MIPRRPLVALLALGTALGLIAAFFPALAPLWSLLMGLLVVAAVLDALLALWIQPPSLVRDVPGSVSLATWVDVQLTFRNHSDNTGIKFQVFDHYPASVQARGMPQTLQVDPGHFVETRYSIRPGARGEMLFPACELRIASRFGLWWRRRKLAVESKVRTYPNYSTISKLLAYEVDNRIQMAGVRMSRRRGEGIEFHQLRDYREGDSMRSIDWKATARMSRLIAREYQDERDQQVVFMLDAGRRMLAKDAELSHFDLALNAMLLLGYVALRQGDSAGVMTIGTSRRWLAPRKGADTITAMLNHVYDVQPSAVEIDYIAAATDLAARQRRRSLIVLLTNVREEDSHDLRAATELLRRRHLVIIGSLRERVLDDKLDNDIQSFDDAVLYAATQKYVDTRRESQNLLRANGVYVEDCLAEDLPSQITNRYLAIKRSGML